MVFFLLHIYLQNETKLNNINWIIILSFLINIFFHVLSFAFFKKNQTHSDYLMTMKNSINWK